MSDTEQGRGINVSGFLNDCSSQSWPGFSSLKELFSCVQASGRRPGLCGFTVHGIPEAEATICSGRRGSS